MSMKKQNVQDMAARLCGALTELGCQYEFQGDNRSDHHSIYFWVRRPKYIEIRVSDHAINKVKRRKQFDIGPHGMPLEQAIEEIAALVRS